MPITYINPFICSHKNTVMIETIQKQRDGTVGRIKISNQLNISFHIIHIFQIDFQQFRTAQGYALSFVIYFCCGRVKKNIRVLAIDAESGLDRKKGQDRYNYTN